MNNLLRRHRALAAVLAASVSGATGMTFPEVANASTAAATRRFGSVGEAVRAGALDPLVIEELASGRGARVLVALDRAAGPREVAASALPGAAPGVAGAAPMVLVPPAPSEIAAAAAQLRSDIGPSPRIYRTYDHLPLAAVEVATEADLLDLVNAGPTAGVSLVETWRAFDAEAVPLIRQPDAAASGSAGTGVVIGVIDSGLTYTNPFFGTCPVVPAAGCRVREMVEIAPGDGSLDDTGHGTFVAATALSAAPAAEVIAYDVFYSTPSGNVTDSATVAAALNHLVARRQHGVNVRVANLSLGGTARYTSTCNPGGSYPAAFATAIANGILPVVASGNGGTSGGVYTDGIASPACVAGAVSVGATYDANGGGVGWSSCTDPTRTVDRPTCFSQGAPILTTYAPGAMLTITGVGTNRGGTSFAAPYVAGAVAALSQRNPGLSPAQLTTVLQSSGPFVFDPRRTGLAANNARRLDLVGALRVGIPLTNDAFASPTPLTVTPGAVGSVDGSTLLATSEPVDATSGLPSIWYAAYAPAVGNLAFAGCPTSSAEPDLTNLNTVWAFTSSGARLPTRGVTSIPSGCPGATAAAQVRLRPGIPARIMVATGVRAGTRLVWQLLPFQPANDNRSAALGLAPSSTIDAEFDGATREPGEVSAFGEAGDTVWFAPGQSATVSAISNCVGCVGGANPPISGERFFAAAWSGSTLLGYGEGAGGTPATVGPFTVPVQVQIGTFGPADIAFSVADNLVPTAPSNDTPATATAIGSGWTGQNALATAPGGELINGSASQRSVWATWTAPSAGTWVVRTIGSNFPTRISVWNGTTNTGTPLCSAGPLGGVAWSQCVVDLTGGQQLLVGLDGVNGAHGTARLEVRQVAPTPRAAAQSGTATGPVRGAAPAAGSGGGPRSAAPDVAAPVL
jgi:hypothetical protein